MMAEEKVLEQTPEVKEPKQKKERKKLGLTSKIFIGLIAGLIVGVIFNLFIPASYVRDTIFVEGIFYVIGQGFIRLMKMLVVPLVFCSLVTGSSSIGDTKTLGKVGGKTIVFYLCTTALAVTIAIGVATLVRPGVGLDMSSIAGSEVTVAEGTSAVDTILNIIPENPFASLAQGTMLQVILFALLVGILLAKMKERGSVIANFLTQANDLMMEMTNLVMKFAPYGVFCMIARTFSNLGFDAFVPLLKYMGSVTGGLAIQLCITYMILLFVFTRLNPLVFLKKFFPVIAFAFSTSTSNATIPLNIETLEEKMGVSRKVSSFTIPLGATVNMDGTSIMQGVAVVFAAQAYGIDLGVTGYLTVIATATLASIGTAGIPSVGLVTLSMVFASVGIPVEAIALIMGVDRILDMMRTAVNITGDAAVTTIVAYQNGDLDKDVFYSKEVKESVPELTL